ncbi:hypothetical protein J5N97_026098 [Dioscorea zingiberensis]|uniref:CCHC-type domain-containing protein n=1 Tax=Dioscorea zingiberensis TaxID=325984 RepID=A0A9D5C256_9LILI|nr:hypothetical protein J5N97_026098 [Dioscorea zingiberensis]
MSKVWRREVTPEPEAVGIQAPPRPQGATHNSPRRDGDTYADAVDGLRPRSFIMEALATPMPPTHYSEDDKGWDDVHFKRRQWPDENKRAHPVKTKRTSPPLGPRQGSPPYIRTPAGLVEVCGQCLKPGHMAADCRRAITYRVCGGIGHKGSDCRRKSSSEDARRPTRHLSPERQKNPQRSQDRGANNQHQPELHQGKRTREGRTDRNIALTMLWRRYQFIETNQ